MRASCHVRWFPPGPATFDLKHQRPTQEGAYQNQPCENAEAGESNLDRNGFHYVGSNQDFESYLEAIFNVYCLRDYHQLS